MPVDALENSLRIGDEVLTTIPHYKGLYKAKIVELFQKTALLKITDDTCPPWIRDRNAIRRSYKETVKIPEEKEV